MALWTCKGDISDFKACNYYSFCLPTAIYTGNTVLAHLDHLPCHPFTMQYVPPLLFVIVWQLFEQCSNISIYLRQIVRFWVSGAPCRQLSNNASAVQIGGLVAELFMFLDYIALWTCKDGISDSKPCNHYSCCITTATCTGNTVLLYPVHPPCHSFTMQYGPPSCLSLFGNCSNNVRTFQYICARLFALCDSGSPWCQLSNGSSAVQIGGVAAELFMFLVIWHCRLARVVSWVSMLVIIIPFV